MSPKLRLTKVLYIKRLPLKDWKKNPEQTQNVPRGLHLPAGTGALGGGVGRNCGGKGHLGNSTECVATATLTHTEKC